MSPVSRPVPLRARAVWMPHSLLVRARMRREMQARALLRARERESVIRSVADDALARILGQLRSGALQLAPSLESFEAGLTDEPVSLPSSRRPAFRTVAFDYRPTTTGRLRSLLARRVHADARFFRDVQSRLHVLLAGVGFDSAFHPHLMQRFVRSGEWGYHATTRVQLLVALTLRGMGTGTAVTPQTASAAAVPSGRRPEPATSRNASARHALQCDSSP